MRCRLAVSEFIATTSAGIAPTKSARPARTSSWYGIHGAGSRKCPSTASRAHLSSTSSTMARAPRGCRPSEFPQKYACSMPACSGRWNSSRSDRSGSAASCARAWASLKSSVMAWLLEAGNRKPEPFKRGPVIQARLVDGFQLERFDGRARRLFAERERIVGAEHHLRHAAGVEEVAQRAL